LIGVKPAPAPAPNVCRTTLPSRPKTPTNTTPAPVPHDLTDIEHMPPRELALLMAHARVLEHTAGGGPAQALLRGRNFGLMNATGEAASGAIAFFDRAATELGAQVAHLHPRLNERSAPAEIEDTAHLLGRLYDGVVCLGMDAGVLRRLRGEAGIPVLDGVPFYRAPSAAGDPRRFLLQALLLVAVS
jgi:ornithine carbamoyltransferase